MNCNVFQSSFKFSKKGYMFQRYLNYAEVLHARDLIIGLMANIFYFPFSL